MSRKKECVAMLLAGGQGSRLGPLTQKRAKPAVKFGGKYRIIDFTLTNCRYSGIDTVGVLTQYEPFELNEYIGDGLPWDMSRQWGGVKILPPYQRQSGSDWYRGTANAVYQNFDFIDRYDPDYVLILSGDHIYRMDYRELISYHAAKRAGCTIAVIDVPPSEASRFGIMSRDGEGRITRFTEKPKFPESTLASMGIYVFGRELLREVLRRDQADPLSAKDFGKNVIPAMLAGGIPLYAYPFGGYWRDVGAITSLWEANMDLLGASPVLDLGEGGYTVCSRQSGERPQFVGRGGIIENSVVSEGCEVHGVVRGSVLGMGVKVLEGAEVCDSVVMDRVRIGRRASVRRAIIDAGANVGAGALVGSGHEIAVVPSGADIPPGGEAVKNEM